MAKRLNEATKKRLRAGKMLLAGKRPAEVDEKIGMARQKVCTWEGLLDEGGMDALRAVPSRGRPAKLDASQLEGVSSAVLQSPAEHGFITELWALNQGAVIERLYGVRFGTKQLWRILGAFGFSEHRSRVRTWAPKGCTPVIQFHIHWYHISVIALLTRTNCLFRLYERSFKKEHVVEFLKALKSHLKRQFLVILGEMRAHRSKLEREYLDGLNGYVHLAFLPPYAHDLNPVEYLWVWLKRHALANCCPANLGESHTNVRNKLKSAQKRPSIIAILLDAGYALVMS